MTWEKITIVAIAIVAVLGWWNKLWDGVSKALPSFQMIIKYFQKKWFSEAVFRKDLMSRMDKQDEVLSEVSVQLHRNGGSTLKDAVTRLEDGQQEIKVLVINNKAVREISDTYSGQMIFRMNAEGGCTFINDAFLKFFGWSEADVLAFGFENLLHDDDVNECRVKWQLAKDRQAKFYDEQRVIDHKGTYHLCTVRASPIMIEGELTSFYGTIEIINERS